MVLSALCLHCNLKRFETRCRDLRGDREADRLSCRSHAESVELKSVLCNRARTFAVPSQWRRLWHGAGHALCFIPLPTGRAPERAVLPAPVPARHSGDNRTQDPSLSQSGQERPRNSPRRSSRRCTTHRGPHPQIRRSRAPIRQCNDDRHAQFFRECVGRLRADDVRLAEGRRLVGQVQRPP